MKFQKILILLIISFSLKAYSSYSGVYYCSDNKTQGFIPQKDFEITSFFEKKFKAKIDFENKEILSEDLYFAERFNQSCILDEEESSILCISELGPSFSFNPVNRYFVRSYHNASNIKSKDTISIAYGTCEKF